MMITMLGRVPATPVPADNRNSGAAAANRIARARANAGRYGRVRRPVPTPKLLKGNRIFRGRSRSGLVNNVAIELAKLSGDADFYFRIVTIRTARAFWYVYIRMAADSVAKNIPYIQEERERWRLLITKIYVYLLSAVVILLQRRIGVDVSDGISTKIPLKTDT